MGDGLKLRRRAPAGGTAAFTLASLPEGALVGLTENGAIAPYILMQHDYGSALNGTGKTLLLRKYVKHGGTCIIWHDENGAASTDPDYSASDIDTWLCTTYYQLLSAEVRALIAPVTIQYTRAVTKDIGTIVRSIFLMSATEIGLPVNTAKYTYNTEGEPVAACTAEVQFAHEDSGVTRRWWSRTPTTNTGVILCANSSATVSYVATNSLMASARPALCIPGATPVADTPNADGVYILA